MSMNALRAASEEAGKALQLWPLQIASRQAELLRQMLGPLSAYSARVRHTDANSGMAPSTDPPNL